MQIFFWRRFLWIFFFSSLLLSCSTPEQKKSVGPAEPEPSSAIPERREFPVNDAFQPCTDFYSYSCSKVNSSFKLRDDRSRHVFAFSDSDERLLEKKKAFLAGLATRDDLSTRGQSLQKVYQACMNAEASKAEETTLVETLVKELQGIKDKDEFEAWNAKKIASEDYSLLDFGDIPNHENPDWSDIYLVGNVMSLPERSYYDKPEVYKALETLATDFFQTIGSEHAEQRAIQIVQFEKDFSKTYPLPAEFRELINKKSGITKNELLSRYPQLHLAPFLRLIPNRTHIRNLTPENFAALSKAFAETPLDTLKDLYLFHAASEFMDDAYPEFFKERFAFNNKHLGGPPVRPERNERCTKMLMGKFNKELDAEMLPRLFPNFPTRRFVKLAEKVRTSILEGIEENQWLNPSSKKAAIEKMKVAKLQLVKPMNDREWDFNPAADYSLDHPYENLRLLKKNLTAKVLNELKKPRDKTRWGMGPLTVNAYYSPPDNKFVLPIGILQYPFFDPALPDEVNLGAVGAVIGHELGHGIDDKGSRYDSKGRLNQWLTDDDLKEFKKRTSKLIDQYNQIGHNGELTLGENIGDLVGVTFAYRTAFPGNEGSRAAKQAFFLEYGRLWCTVIRPKLREKLLKTDPHAQGEARVNEQVKHQPGFAEAFGCKKGDALFLPEEERVKVW